MDRLPPEGLHFVVEHLTLKHKAEQEADGDPSQSPRLAQYPARDGAGLRGPGLHTSTWEKLFHSNQSTNPIPRQPSTGFLPESVKLTLNLIFFKKTKCVKIAKTILKRNKQQESRPTGQ